MTLTEIASITQGTLVGDASCVKQFSIDTRTLNEGDVYIAIRGENLDGHQFISKAKESGAAGVIVDHPIDTVIPHIIVDNTEHALQRLSAHHRRKMAVKAIAVTGSCGKTTTRAFLQSIFSQAGSTHASVGSFNNHIGVPLTLLKLKPTHQFLISEVGANHSGEIAQLIPLIQPHVAIITNVGPAHLEGFGSTDNVAKAKAEIYSGLSSEGVAVINNDDAFAPYWKTINKNRSTLTFGINTIADVMASTIRFDERGFASFTLVLPHGKTEITLPILGEHNIYNALAAAAAGVASGLTLSQIKQGLEETNAVPHRLIEQQVASGATVIDDSYNANPLSTKAALHVLAKRAGKTIFVLGDMKELGVDAEKSHADIGSLAKALGINYLFCYGDLTKHAIDTFGEQGIHFSDKADLIDRLKAQLTSSQTILVKGSHSMKMNEVVEALTR